ncbi:MAG: hypothetical protein HC923_10405 [Myxococcales bacterium]|nr:hypothetical protein [Myxococcales bacterium]
MDGNAWRFVGEDAETQFSTPHTPVFHPLDLYLMGLGPLDDVPAMKLITSFRDKLPTWVNISKDALPAHRRDVVISLQGVTVVDVDPETVIDANGPREPVQSPEVWPVGVVLISAGFAGTAGPSERAKFQAALDEMILTYETATLGRMRLRAETSGAATLGRNATCEGSASCNPAESDGCHPTLGMCQIRCTTDAECGEEEACCDGWCGPSSSSCATPDGGLEDVTSDAVGGAPEAGADLSEVGADAGDVRAPESSCQSSGGASAPFILFVWLVVAKMQARLRRLSPSRGARSRAA